jgi:hypothetical protein
MLKAHEVISVSGIPVEFLGLTPTQNRIASPSTYRGFSKRRTGSTPAARFSEEIPAEDDETDEPVTMIKKNPTIKQADSPVRCMAVTSISFD